MKADRDDSETIRRDGLALMNRASQSKELNKLYFGKRFCYAVDVSYIVK